MVFVSLCSRARASVRVPPGRKYILIVARRRYGRGSNKEDARHEPASRRSARCSRLTSSCSHRPTECRLRSAAEQLEHDEHDDGQSEPAAEEPDEERPAGSAFFFVFLRGHGVILSAALRRTPARGRQEDVVQRWCHPGSYLAAVLAPRVR